MNRQVFLKFVNVKGLFNTKKTMLIPLSSISKIDFREKEVQFHYGKSLFDAGIINAHYKEGITKEYMFDEFESKINGYKTIIEI
jgi:hypothetical protein